MLLTILQSICKFQSENSHPCNAEKSHQFKSEKSQPSKSEKSYPSSNAQPYSYGMDIRNFHVDSRHVLNVSSQYQRENFFT